MIDLLSHNHNAILFFSSLLLSLWLTPPAIRFSFRINAVDRVVFGFLAGLAVIAVTGSLLLGYTLSAVCIMLVRHDGTGTPLAPVTAAAVLALPILDTLLVMAGRAWKRENPFRPDRTHLHHRLLDLGLPHGAVVPILYVSTALFGFQAWGLRSHPEWLQLAAVFLLAAALYGTLYLARLVRSRWNGAETAHAGPDKGLYPVLARIMGKSVRGAAWVIAVGLLLPTLVLDAVPRPVSVAALAVGVFVTVLFPWRSKRYRSSVCYGLLYAATVFLLAVLQAVPGAPRWMPGYLAGLSALVMGWVLLKMKYRGHREIALVSGFEILMIGVTLFIPIVLVPALALGEGIRRMMLTVCLESVVFLMAMKLVVVHKPRRSPVFAAGFLVALLLLGAKGLLFDHVPSVLFSSPPSARTSHPVPAVLHVSSARSPSIPSR